MKSLIESKLATMIVLALVVVLICATFRYRYEWWMFADIFFAFMTIFTHLMSLTVRKFSPVASKKLDVAALICGVLFIIAFIVEFILWEVEF